MNRLISFVFLLSFCACTSPGAGECPVEFDLITPVMAELHLAEALSFEAPVLVRDSIQELYFNKVLEDHELSRASFDSLLAIIRQEPVWVDSLYTRIGEELARTETELEE